MKFVPFTVIVPFGGNWPTGVLDGESEVIVGTGLFAGLIVKVAATSDGPPGKGLTTVICGKPVLAMYAAGTLTESCCVLALNVTVAQVVEGGGAVTQLPFQNTCEVVMNPVPDGQGKGWAARNGSVRGKRSNYRAWGERGALPPQQLIRENRLAIKKRARSAANVSTPASCKLHGTSKLFVSDSRESGKRDAKTPPANPPPQSDTRIDSTPARHVNSDSPGIRLVGHWILGSTKERGMPQRICYTLAFESRWDFQTYTYFSPLPAQVARSRCAEP